MKGKADQLSIGIGRKLEKEKADEHLETVKKIEEPEIKTEVKPAVKPEVKTEEKPEIKAEVIIESPVVKEIPVAKVDEVVVEKAGEVIKARKEKVEEPKIIGKIDLDKKKTKKVEEEPVKKVEPIIERLHQL